MQESKKLSFQEVLSKIETADDFEMSEILLAVMRRYKTAFPDWKFLCISCPKDDPAERQKTLEILLEHFRNHA